LSRLSNVICLANETAPREILCYEIRRSLTRVNTQLNRPA
jgi:hypothetical protein